MIEAPHTPVLGAVHEAGTAPLAGLFVTDDRFDFGDDLRGDLL